jgi:hypothetical protein
MCACAVLTPHLAVAAFALIFSMKIGVLPENLFNQMFNDRLVTKGTMLEFITIFFQVRPCPTCLDADAVTQHLTHSLPQELLAKDNMDDLVSLLTKARVVNRLMEFFPPSKRTLEDFNTHFKVRCSSWPAVTRAQLW